LAPAALKPDDASTRTGFFGCLTIELILRNMGVPKRKPSKSRQRMRRAYNSKLTLPQLSTCPQCAAPYVPHRVCPACGFYKERQVITVTAGA
jgi:large subunit ribosomal protein L32